MQDEQSLSQHCGGVAVAAAISFVMITKDRAHLLQQTLPPILQYASEHGYEVIVVDDGSHDQTAEFLYGLSSFHSCLRVIAHTESCGIGRARNAGLRLATGEVIVSMDDDVAVDETVLDRAKEAFLLHPSAGIVAPEVRDVKTARHLNGMRWRNSRASCAANHHGAFAILRRQAVLATDLIDEECTYGAEERSRAMKVHALGYDIIFDPTFVATHIDIMDRTRPSIERLSMRAYNNVRLNFRYLPRMKAAVFSARYVSSLLRAAWPATLQGVPRILSAASSGALQGLRQHVDLPERSVRFYTDPRLCPEYGNVPVRVKVAQRVRGRCTERRTTGGSEKDTSI